MWKFVFLLSSFIVVQASVDDCLGKLTLTAFYPVREGVTPMCGQMNFLKAPGDSSCTCDDGRQATLLDVAHVGQDLGVRNLIPVVAVEGNSVTLNVKCACGSRQYPGRFGLRTINSNYCVLYIGPEGNQTPKNVNNMLLHAKNVKSRSELDATIQGIDDMRNKEITVMCTKE